MTDNAKQSPWKRPRRWVPLALLLLLVLAVTAYRLSVRSGPQRSIAALQSRGLPTSPLEVDKWYTNVPASQNAALAFLDACALYVDPGTNNPSEMNDAKVVVGEPLPSDLAKAVENHLMNNREAISAAHEAAELTQSRYPIDLTKGFHTLLPHLAQVKKLSQLLKWEAIQQSSAGHRDAAVKALRSNFAVADSLQNEPLLISELVRLAILTQCLTALEWVVTEQSLSDAELLAFIQILARTEEQGRASLQRALSGERGIGTAIFQANYAEFEALLGGGIPIADDLPGLFRMALFQARRSSGMADVDLAFYLDHMGELDRSMAQDYPEMLRQSEEIHNDTMERLEANRIRYLMSGMMLPSLEKAAQRESLVTAHLRCARMALAIERYRLAHGKIPTLTELVPDYLPEVLTDPVDGAPLQYQQQSIGYRIQAAAATELKNEGKKPKNRTEVAFTVAK